MVEAEGRDGEVLRHFFLVEGPEEVVGDHEVLGFIDIVFGAYLF